METNESVELDAKAVGTQKKKKKKDNPFEPKGFAGSIYVMLHDMVAILAVIVIVLLLAARLVGVSGSSMYPTLVGARESEEAKGDYLILRPDRQLPDGGRQLPPRLRGRRAPVRGAHQRAHGGPQRGRRRLHGHGSCGLLLPHGR